MARKGMVGRGGVPMAEKGQQALHLWLTVCKVRDTPHPPPPPKPPERGGPGLDTLPGAPEAVVRDWAPEGPEAPP